MMSRTLFSAPVLKNLFSDGISFLATRRGITNVAEVVRRSPKAEKTEAATKFMAAKRAARADPDPWVPDPVTGYYRPANQAVEVDSAELRAMLLGTKP